CICFFWFGHDFLLLVFNGTRRQHIERAMCSGTKRQSKPRQLIVTLPRGIVEGATEKPERSRRFRMAEIETALSRAGTSLYPWRHRRSLRRGRPYRRRAEPLSSGSSREFPSSPERRWPGRLC